MGKLETLESIVVEEGSRCGSAEIQGPRGTRTIVFEDAEVAEDGRVLFIKVPGSRHKRHSRMPVLVRPISPCLLRDLLNN